MEFKWSEEQKAVFDTRGNVLVSASAGSGKTTVMIEKILRLIEEGQDLRRILVMTFSRASAMDMKTKLVEKMYKRLSFGGETERIRKQLENIPFANISTINSFCYTLAKRYFSAAGIDPSCSIMDDKEQESLFDACLDRTIKKQLEKKSPDPSFIRALGYFSEKRSIGGIKRVICSLHTFLSAQEDPEEFLGRANGMEKTEEYYLERMRRKLFRLQTEGREILREKREQNYPARDEVYRDCILRMENATKGGIREFFSEISGMEVPARNPHSSDCKKGFLLSELCDRCGEFLAKMRKLKSETESDRALYEQGDSDEEIKKVVIKLYQENKAEYEDRKKQRSVMDFNDAERAALNILKWEEYREEIRKSFDYIFIDEYQDTNYLQEALLVGLSRGDNLFVVGDVKQAIYHFRYAEPEIFVHRKKRYENVSEGNSRLLNDNYRSCNRILTFTNEVCAEVMTDLFGGVDYRAEAMLHSGLGEEGAEDAVRIYTYPEEETVPVPVENVYRVKTGSKIAKRDREAAFIADEIARQHARGRKYEEFAVLFKKRKGIPGVAKELKKRGIPYFVQQDKKSTLPERETIIDCLRLLLNDFDDIAMINVLTEMFGFGAKELLDVRLSSEKSFSEAVLCYQGPHGEKLAEFREQIVKWRFDAEYLTVADLMREIIKSGYDAVLMKKGVIGQINAFILFVEQQADKMSLGEFIRYYDTVYDGNITPAPPSSVTLMTQHGSKGLEFPVVFLPYSTAAKRTRGQRESIVCDRDLGIALYRYSDDFKMEKTFSLYVMAMKKRAEEQESDLRLAYVAFTRAKEKLIITGMEKNYNGEAEDAACVMDWLLYAKQRNGELEKYFLPMPETEDKEEVPCAVQPVQLDLTKLEKTYPFEKSTKTYAKTSVSGILQQEESKGVRTLPAESAQKAEVGNAMHAVLRFIDFSAQGKEEVAFEIDRMVKEGLLTERERELADCQKIAEVLSAPEMAPAKSNPLYREYPFIAYVHPKDNPVDKILVQGVIDLLVALPDDTFMLVDYKMSGLGPEKLKTKYAEQIELYRDAVQNILHKPVSVAFLYNLNLGFSVRL